MPLSHIDIVLFLNNHFMTYGNDLVRLWWFTISLSFWYHWRIDQILILFIWFQYMFVEVATLHFYWEFVDFLFYDAIYVFDIVNGRHSLCQMTLLFTKYCELSAILLKFPIWKSLVLNCHIWMIFPVLAWEEIHSPCLFTSGNSRYLWQAIFK